jgi:plasmid stabilization system protein ParE
MDFKVFVSSEALSDLERIVAYIALDEKAATGCTVAAFVEVSPAFNRG